MTEARLKEYGFWDYTTPGPGVWNTTGGMTSRFFWTTWQRRACIRKRSINRIFFPATSGAIFGPSIRTKEQHCGRVDEGTSLASTDQVLLAAASDRLEGKPAESV